MTQSDEYLDPADRAYRALRDLVLEELRDDEREAQRSHAPTLNLTAGRARTARLGSELTANEAWR